MGLFARLFKRLHPGQAISHLNLDEHQVPLASEQDLEALLKVRVSPSEAEKNRLRNLATFEVEGEYRLADEASQRTLDMLVKTMETRHSLADAWAALDISAVPEDQRWPQILFQLGSALDWPDTYRRLALTRYLQYLNARRDCLRRVLAGRGVETAEIVRDRLEGVPPQARRPARAPGFARLPHGRPVRLEPMARMDLYLGRYRLAVVREPEGFRIITATGESRNIPTSGVLLGRGSQCDLVLGDSGSGVSRRHVSIHPTAAGALVLTDLSSRGTYLPKEYLRAAQSPG
ncbi:MAG: FHA domain-containing protein, partial [Gammaproteobacteria bacterium]